MPADIFRDDVCALFMLAALLCYAGSFVAAGQDALRQKGAYLGLATVVGVVGVRVYELQSLEPTDLLPVVLSALLTGCAVAGAAWLALPVLNLAWQLTGAPVVRNWRALRQRARQRRSDRQRRRDEARAEQRRLAQDRALAPERERQRREAEIRAQLAAEAAQKLAQQQALDRQEREAVRLRLEMLYQMHQPEIKDRFPQDFLRNFLQTQLSDQQPLPIVHERAAQFETLLHHHLEKIAPTPRHRSLAELAVWLDEQQRQIATIVDPKLQEFARSMLFSHYTERTKQLLRESAP